MASAAGHPALAVSFLSPELADMVGVRQVGTARTGSGLSAVHAAFHNCTDTDVVLLVRTRFGNAVQPGPAEPPSAWRTLVLAPRTQADYGESAIAAASIAAALEILDAQRAQQPYRLFKENSATVADAAGALSAGLMSAAMSAAGGANGANASLAQGVGAAGAAGSLLSVAAGALSRAANAEADTSYWASLPKTIYVQGLAAPLADPAAQFSTGGKARHGECSLAWSREYPAFDAEHGGVANPSPWPAEPVESGREHANAALRNAVLALPFVR